MMIVEAVYPINRDKPWGGGGKWGRLRQTCGMQRGASQGKGSGPRSMIKPKSLREVWGSGALGMWGHSGRGDK